MQRWDIINHLIKQNNYKSYLEIGYYKGWSFDRVECEGKTAVDPNPCKTPDQESHIYGTWICEEGEMYSAFPPVTKCNHVIRKETSDEFFDEIGEAKYDIIFIDGLHESQQVDRDIQNALKHLSPGGTIVMHDCNPSTYEMTTTGTALGEWTGDVYKSFIKFRFANLYTYDTYVVDTDYGVGIIKPRETTLSPYIMDMSHVDWKEFDRSRIMYLSLISPEEFLKRNQ